MTEIRFGAKRNQGKFHLLKMFFDENTNPRRLAVVALVTASNRAFLDEDVADAEEDTHVVKKCKK